MSLTDTEDEVEVIEWGDGVSTVIHGGDEGEWIMVEDDDHFLDLENNI